MSARLLTENHAVWGLEGELTFATVAEMDQSGTKLFKSPPDGLDLKQLQRIDSAGLALLVEWSRQAKISGSDLKLINASPQLLALSQMANLDSFLRFQ